jgi:hypothetical protein
MIKKLLLIDESGLLPFFLNQDKTNIDNDLLSGFCSAIHSLSLELTFPLKNIDFQDHVMTIEQVKHPDNLEFLIASFFEDFHISEGVKNKMRYIFKRFFKSYDFQTETRRIKNKNLIQEIKDILNEIPFKIFITHHLEQIKPILNPIIEEEGNGIDAYSLNSSCNTILYCYGRSGSIYDPNFSNLKNLIRKYLRIWKIESIPQGDQFTGPELPTGLNLTDYCNTGQKTLGLVINTSINLKEEPHNELLLYFFGKNMLLRSFVLNIEEELRKVLQTKYF